MNFNIKSKNTNYLAKVFVIKNLAPHSNAQKLQICLTDGNSVITGLDAKIGDLYIYFPIECAINKDYLAWSNSFSTPELNKDTKKKGFFSDTGRVKAIKLRGLKSEGYIIPASDLFNWIKTIDKSVKIDQFEENVEFDSYGDVLICEKYINRQALIDLERQAKAEARKGKKAKRVSKVVENQFRVSEDTAALKKNIVRIDPNDYVSISYKMHGCNTSLGKVICRKPLKWYEKILKKIGINIIDTEYDLLWASRTVIKNQFVDKKHESYYEVDVWGLIANKYKDSIKNGITLYGEIVGQLSTGRWIQTDYDYGCKEKESELYIYRITYTNSVGEVLEFTTPQIQRYCAKMGLKTVPIFYYGRAKDIYPELQIGEHWHAELLNKLTLQYTEKKCYLCASNVPEEGVVMTKEGDFFEGYKLKSFAFLERETKEIDKGIVSVEDVEANKIQEVNEK